MGFKDFLKIFSSERLDLFQSRFLRTPSFGGNNREISNTDYVTGWGSIQGRFGLAGAAFSWHKECGFQDDTAEGGNSRGKVLFLDCFATAG